MYKRGAFNVCFSKCSKETICFCDIYRTASEGGTPATSNQKYYKNGSIPFAKIEDLSEHYITETKSYITEDGLKNSSAWIIPSDSIVFSNGATIGACAINKVPMSTKQGILGIVPQNEYSVEYLYHYFISEDFMHKIKLITTKGTMDCAYLKDINNVVFQVPTLEEQRKIAKVLNKIGYIIEKNAFILNNLIEIKQGLLQKMFI